MECEYCKLVLKSKYTLKTHLVNNKACLKLRGLDMISKFTCNGCNTIFMNKTNLSIHLESCKKFFLLKIDKELETLKDNHKNDLNIKMKELEHKYKQEYNTLKFKYNELLERYNKDREWFEIKLNKYEAIVEGLAKDGINKPTTINNNTIRNHLSSIYTLDNLENKQIENTMRDNYTEHDFFGGQKRLANFFFEKVIKTPDDKMLICCTDTSRKKFKILDLRGNLKEDIEARLLCEKLKVPIQTITKEIYDKVINKIDTERDRLSFDDRSKREKLLDDTMRVQRVYNDNMNFDDLNYNQDFMHELCVLLNV